MSHFDEKELLKLTQLSRIECTAEERIMLAEKLGQILSHVTLLGEVDTRGVAPCNHMLEEIVSVMREDVVGELLPREVFLANAPAHTGGMIRTPPVMKSSP